MLDVKPLINIGVTCVLPYSHPLILSFLLFWLSCCCFSFLSLTLQYRLSAYTSCGNLWLKIMGFSSNTLPNMHLHFSLIIKLEIRSIHFKLIPNISTTSSFFFFLQKLYPGFCNLSLCAFLLLGFFWSQLAPKLSVPFSWCADARVFDGCYRICLPLS